MVDAPIKWIGGKSKFVDKIVEIMPEHICYVEVFGGAGWILLGKPESRVEVYNDLNKELVNFYTVLRDNLKEFVDKSNYIVYSREFYNQFYKDFQSGKHFTFNNVERAFRFFYIIANSFNGEFGVGMSFNRDKSRANEFFNRFESVEKVNKRLKKVNIDCLDFEKCINNWDSENTLYFVDPPYYKAPVDDYYFKSYSHKTGFGPYEHQRLYQCLQKIKGKFIITYDDCDWVRDRYSKFNIINFQVHYSSASTGSDRFGEGKYVNELIITNYIPGKVKRHSDIKQGTLEF